MINSAVDVYSCGVVFFQMLYGRKPFGQGLSSDDMASLSQRTSAEAHRVVFPEVAGQVITEGCKRFIAQCLHYDPTKRPKIEELLGPNDSYFAQTMTSKIK